jgi:hypothetical protein
MPYLVRKRMTLDGKAYTPGDIVPQGTVESIRPGRLDSMVRLSHLQQVTPNQATKARRETTTPSDEGEKCPVCDGGPYKNLNGHMGKMHKAQEE